MEEVQETKFVGKHGHNLASYREVVSFHIFFHPTRCFSRPTCCCIPGFILRCCIYYVALILCLSYILFRNRAISEIRS